MYSVNRVQSHSVNIFFSFKFLYLNYSIALASLFFDSGVSLLLDNTVYIIALSINWITNDWILYRLTITIFVQVHFSKSEWWSWGTKCVKISIGEYRFGCSWKLVNNFFSSRPERVYKKFIYPFGSLIFHNRYYL